MNSDREKTIVLKTTNTAFEAETIVEALRDRGIRAHALDIATNQAWGMNMGPVGGVKIVVMESQFLEAKSALADMNVTSASIDWDSIDVGDDREAQEMLQSYKTRRWMLTLMIFLLPGGLVVFSFGQNRGDVVLSAIGTVCMATAIVMGFSLLWPSKRDKDE